MLFDRGFCSLDTEFLEIMNEPWVDLTDSKYVSNVFFFIVTDIPN